MLELEAGTSTSLPGADIRKSEMGAESGASQVEVDRCILAEAADSRVQAVGALNVAPRHSIAVVRRLETQPAVSGHSSMTLFVVSRASWDKWINVT
jgi:hypothetical protein